MTSSSNNHNKINSSLSAQLTTEQLNNKRIAVRYIGTDIIAALKLLGIFNSKKKYSIELIDISSKGVAIKSKKNIAVGKNIVLYLAFKDKTIFRIPAKIVYENKTKQQYGVKFDQINNKLGDFLVSSRQDLLFK